MCGSYSIIHSQAELSHLLPLVRAWAPYLPNKRLRPTDWAPIIQSRIGDPTGWHGGLARWGLVPAWALDAKGAANNINARSETITELPTWRDRIPKAAGRCLIPASGYYEWHGGARHLIRPAAGKVFLFAGLYGLWMQFGDEWPGFSIITSEPNKRVAQIHDRMPVILGQKGADLWLDGKAKIPDLKGLLRPCAEDWVEIVPEEPVQGELI